MMLMVQEYGTILYKRPRNSEFPGALAEVYEYFASTYNGKIKDSTTTSYRIYLMVSANYLAEHKITDINDITPEIIVQFTLTLSRYSSYSAEKIMRLFAKLLRCAFEHGFSDEDKSRYCMNVKFYEGEKIPPTFSKNEIEMLLETIDCSTSSGKRDDAMIILNTNRFASV